MKLHFEPNLDYQRAAIDAVTELFRGQEACRTEFTVTRRPVIHGQASLGLEGIGFVQGELGLAQNVLGVGNRLTLLDDEIVKNLREIQIRNGLRPSEHLASGDFTVEMETGTGKTYVYLRTIFELNQKYGFTKFVIVVPSVAIKEGVYKTLQMTEEHFRGIYANTPFEYFIYDSAKLGQVRNFATSPNIQIMIVTVGAINRKDVNNLYKDSEKRALDWKTYTWLQRSVWLENILLHRPKRWLPEKYPNYDELLTAAIEAAVNDPQAPKDLASWRWGTFNALDIQHPILGKIPMISHWSGPGLREQSGSGYTVKAVTPYHGPSERFTANLADFDQSTLNTVTGQGGNFLSPYYMDQWKAWYEGTTFTLPFSPKAVASDKTHQLTMEPAKP